MADASRTRVLSAAYELKGRTGLWPTAREITDYLQVEHSSVTAALRELRDKRLMCDRQRENRKVWMPWGAP